MPLPIPNLDDRTFDQLVNEAKALIPKHFPSWTDHNFSDPGITFLELFAFLMESAIYQINRVPERSLEHFASLLGVAREPGESIEALFRRVRNKLDARERAITREEIEHQILEQRWPPGDQKLARAEVIVHPEEGTRLKVIIVPKPKDDKDNAPTPGDDLRQAVYEFLRERVPICTRLQVLAPQYSSIELKATLVRSAQSRLDRKTVERNVLNAVRELLHPTRGGDDRRGWPPGRSIFRSELYSIIEGLPGVDHVQELLLRAARMRLSLGTALRHDSPGSIELPTEQVVQKSEELPVYSPPAHQEDLEEIRSELRVRDNRFQYARPLIEWQDIPFKAKVKDREESRENLHRRRRGSMITLDEMNDRTQRIRFRDYLPEVIRGDANLPSFQDRFLQAFEDVFEELQSLLEGVFPGDLHLTVDSDPLSRSPEFSKHDFINFFMLVNRLRAQLPKISNEDAAGPKDPVSLFLVKRFSPEARKGLDQQDSTIEQLKTELNNVLRDGGSIYEAQRFASVVLSVETLALKSQDPQGEDLIRLNRLLLEDAYPLELAKVGAEVKVKPPSSPVEFPENTFVTLSRSPEFSERDFIDFSTLVKRLRAQLPKISEEDATGPKDPVSFFLVYNFSPKAKKMLSQHPKVENLRKKLAEELNNVLRHGGSIYEAQRFVGVILSVKTLTLKSQNPQGEDLVRLNRLLLEDAYPLELARIGTDSTTLAADYPGEAGPTRVLVRDVDFAEAVAQAPGSALVLHAGGVPDLFHPDLTPPPQFARRIGLDDDYRPEPDSAFLNFLASWIGLPLRDQLIAREGEEDVNGHPRPDDPTYSRRKARWNQQLIRRAVGIYPRRGTLAGVKEMLRAWLKDDVAEGGVIVTDFVRHHTDVDTIFQLGERSRLGIDTVLGEGPPFFFIADLTADPTVPGLRNPAGIDILLREAQFVLQTETPAHTYYQLRVRASTMQLAAQEGGERPGEIYAQIGKTTQLWGEPAVFPTSRAAV